MRPVQIDTPLGSKLLFRRLRGTEEIGRLFQFDVDLITAEDDVDFTKVVGQPMTVHLEIPGAEPRNLNGIVTRFAHAGGHGRFGSQYRATLRPTMWLLTRRADCRIFQNMTVPDIIKKIFRDHGLSDFTESLSGSYSAREYCVQYRETDFDFVSRLMEEEGIYYFFDHKADKHDVVLADSYSAHSPFPGYSEVPYYPKIENARRERDHIDSWGASEELAPGAYALRDYFFEQPKTDLGVKLSSQHKLAKKQYEIYDYPGEYEKAADGETYVKIRLEEQYARQGLASGQGNAKGIAPGKLFTMTNFARADQNKEYLVVRAEYELDSDAYESATPNKDDPVFRCTFSAIDSQRPYRSERVTSRPVMQGPQTAIVVGKASEEIWTDEHGRVKVQFHWDREGASDENSSCWIRVAQIWAGGKWGSIQIPRIGQEVVVEFLEGDPDRPLITGRLYNGDQKVPYALPANATQSGIKSRSTKDAGEANFNEIRFEDKKGSEHIFIQAEKDLEVVVENNATHSIGKNETTTIGSNRTESVGKDESISIAGSRTESVAKDETLSVDGARTRSVAKDESVSIGGSSSLSVDKDRTVSITGGETVEIGKDSKISVTGERTVSVGKSETLDVGKKMVINVADELVLKVGDATITMKKNGDITLKGGNITLDGKKLALKASGAVAISGSTVGNN